MGVRTDCRVKVIRDKEINSANKIEFTLTYSFHESDHFQQHCLQKLALVCIGLLSFEQTGAAQEDRLKWHTGAAFQRQLRKTTSITWVETPLRNGLERLARAQKVFIFLDRRVDPDQRVSLSIQDLPLETVIQQLALTVGAQAYPMGSLVYVGPKADATRVATLAEIRRQDARALDGGVAKRYFRRNSWEWPMLTTPRQLCEDVEKSAGCKMVGLEQIPHDLYPETHFPPTSTVDFLTLLTAGFDLTFVWEDAGRVVRLLPAPHKVRLTDSYAVGGGVASRLAEFRAKVPAAVIVLEDDQLVVSGDWADHQIIRELLSGRRKPVDVDSRAQRYTLRGKFSAGKVLQQVVDQLDLRLNLEPGLFETLQRPVEVDVREATLDELLEAILKPLQIHFEIKGDRLYLRL